jgi:hypothetical protein
MDYADKASDDLPLPRCVCRNALNIPAGTAVDERAIKKSFRAQSKLYHPDRWASGVYYSIANPYINDALEGGDGPVSKLNRGMWSTPVSLI